MGDFFLVSCDRQLSLSSIRTCHGWTWQPAATMTSAPVTPRAWDWWVVLTEWLGRGGCHIKQRGTRVKSPPPATPGSHRKAAGQLSEHNPASVVAPNRVSLIDESPARTALGSDEQLDISGVMVCQVGDPRPVSASCPAVPRLYGSMFCEFEVEGRAW